MPEDFCRFETPKIQSSRVGFENEERSFENAHSVDAIGPEKMSL
jgi:hypothetical protein